MRSARAPPKSTETSRWTCHETELGPNSPSLVSMDLTVAGYPSGAMGSNAIGLFGTGVMARGIAELCLSNGISLVVRSASDERAAAFRDELVQANAAAAVSRDPRELERCRLFLEATVEEVEPDRKSVVEGKRVDLGGRRII